MRGTSVAMRRISTQRKAVATQRWASPLLSNAPQGSAASLLRKAGHSRCCAKPGTAVAAPCLEAPRRA